MTNEKLYALIVHAVRDQRNPIIKDKDYVNTRNIYAQGIQDAAMSLIDEREVKEMFRNARRLVEMEQQSENQG